MLEVESRLGRVRHIPNGPRTIDLDLLWMGAAQLATPDLELPHPRMLERAFVLVPLADIVPNQDPSGLYSIVHTALNSVDGKDGIQLWKTCSWRNDSAPSEAKRVHTAGVGRTYWYIFDCIRCCGARQSYSRSRHAEHHRPNARD